MVKVVPVDRVVAAVLWRQAQSISKGSQPEWLPVVAAEVCVLVLVPDRKTAARSTRREGRASVINLCETI
jgi:hypothetical protein